MMLLERYRILVWAGGALLGWIAGDIMVTDPAVIGWMGETTVHELVPWAGRAGAVFVVGLGLSLVRQQRPLSLDEFYAGAAVLGWAAGEAAIDAVFAESHVLNRWLMRGAILLVLAAGYVLWRSRRPIEAEEL